MNSTARSKVLKFNMGCLEKIEGDYRETLNPIKMTLHQGQPCSKAMKQSHEEKPYKALKLSHFTSKHSHPPVKPSSLSLDHCSNSSDEMESLANTSSNFTMSNVSLKN